MVTIQSCIREGRERSVYHFDDMKGAASPNAILKGLGYEVQSCRNNEVSRLCQQTASKLVLLEAVNGQTISHINTMQTAHLCS